MFRVHIFWCKSREQTIKPPFVAVTEVIISRPQGISYSHFAPSRCMHTYLGIGFLLVFNYYTSNACRFAHLSTAIRFRDSRGGGVGSDPPGCGYRNSPDGGGLTRHRLGCFCTHHSLGGRSDPTPVLSRKRIDVERRTRRHSKDLDETLPKHFRKLIEVTCQVKVRSKVKIGCFQVADCSNLKRGIFPQNFPYVLPRTRRRYWLVKLFHI